MQREERRIWRPYEFPVSGPRRIAEVFGETGNKRKAPHRGRQWKQHKRSRDAFSTVIFLDGEDQQDVTELSMNWNLSKCLKVIRKMHLGKIQKNWVPEVRILICLSLFHFDQRQVITCGCLAFTMVKIFWKHCAHCSDPIASSLRTSFCDTWRHLASLQGKQPTILSS